MNPYSAIVESYKTWSPQTVAGQRPCEMVLPTSGSASNICLVCQLLAGSYTSGWNPLIESAKSYVVRDIQNRLIPLYGHAQVFIDLENM